MVDGMSDYKPLPNGWKCKLEGTQGGYLGILRLRDAGGLRLTGPYETTEAGWRHIRLLAEEDNIRWDDAFLVKTDGMGLLNCSDYGPGEMRWVNFGKPKRKRRTA